ncbi:hypothetical protein [Thauera humireducens]|uniref:hypothetical protein n=1 Tax=Thauera humireducens TaxID=1134435 RepID=UPI00311D65CE
MRTDSEGDHSLYRLALVLGVASEHPCRVSTHACRASTSASRSNARATSTARRSTIARRARRPRRTSTTWRDYASLRRLLIDRLSRTVPGWRDRSPADLATTLAELIAYVGDLQHYQLDAIATEAYLGTARRRTSPCAATRCWSTIHCTKAATPEAGCIWTCGGPFALPAGIRFYTRVPGIPPRIDADSPEERNALQAGPLVFEPMHAPTLRETHNRFELYTWGDARCLPAGATAATLRGHHPELAAGAVLIFPGNLWSADRSGRGRQPRPAATRVRLTAVLAFAGSDPLTDPLDGSEITEIRWHADDALPFSLCLSSETDATHGSRQIDGVSIALGNNLLVDHGRSVVGEHLGRVPAPRLHYPPRRGRCLPAHRTRTPATALPPAASGGAGHAPRARCCASCRTTAAAATSGSRSTPMRPLQRHCVGGRPMHCPRSSSLTTAVGRGRQGAICWPATDPIPTSSSRPRTMVRPPALRQRRPWSQAGQRHGLHRTLSHRQRPAGQRRRRQHRPRSDQ